jgi:hypothetical protein
MADPHKYLGAAKVVQLTELLESLNENELMGVMALLLSIRSRKRDEGYKALYGEHDPDAEFDIPLHLQWPKPAA